jgi:hypothetical protein
MLEDAESDILAFYAFPAAHWRKLRWLVGRAYLSAESISLVLAGRDDHIDKEIKEEVAQLQAV